MKQMLLFSAVLIAGMFFTNGLNAQSCQPSPACKVVCSAAKAGIQNDGAASQITGAAQAVAVSQPSSASTMQKSAACNPAKCDLSKCDPTKCDLSKCDPAKCDPADCDLSKCIPANGSGSAKAKTTRI